MDTRSKVFLSLIAILFTSTLYLLYLNFSKIPTATTSTLKTGIVPTTDQTPAIISTVNSTANWKAYNIITEPTLGLANYQIKLPSTWVQIEHSSNFQNTETFQDTNTNFIYQLIIHQEENINPQTSKPYTTLKELTGFPYDVSSLIVDDKLAARVLPRAGSETDYMVLFFSKDNKLTFSIELDTPRDGSKTQEGGVIFTQILSTFKFTDQTQTTPAAISNLFNSLNQLFGSSIIPTQTNSFIEDGRETTQTAWKLDLNSVAKDKPDYTKVINLFENQLKYKTTGGADDATGGGDTFYESSLLKCDLKLFTNDKSVVCVEK